MTRKAAHEIGGGGGEQSLSRHGRKRIYYISFVHARHDILWIIYCQCYTKRLPMDLGRPIALRSTAWREELAGHQDQRERLRRHQAKNQMLSFGDTVSTSVISVNWKESCLPTCSTKRPIPVRVIPRPPKICTASRAVSCAVCVAYIFSRAIGPARCFACSLYDCIHSLFLNIK